MSDDPTKYIAEILGQKPYLGLDPSDQNFHCPFTKKQCSKRANDIPYPVCTIKRKNSGDPVCVCPKRFYEIDFVSDVLKYAWPFLPPKNPVVATEVKMEGFGNVDYVLADKGATGKIENFLSIELQAIDITGTVKDAYESIVSGQYLINKKNYGLNWKNVYKRYIHQLISKGFYHHHWESKIIAILQDKLYNYMKEDASFLMTKNVKDKNTNIIFMVYKFEYDTKSNLVWTLDNVEGTHHSNLQSAILYKTPPSRSAFCQKIEAALSR